jgi:virginiamycin B lyase
VGAVLVLVVAGTTVAAAQVEARAITVTPDTGLVDGQTITVSGTGFTGQSELAFYQCAGPSGLEDCRRVLAADDSVPVANDGTFWGSGRVRAVFTDNGTTHDCRVEACTLAVDYVFRIDSASGRPSPEATGTPEGDDFPLAKAPIAFDPAGPLLPPPVLTATPDTGLVDGQSVDVAGTGYTPDSTVRLTLCPTASTSIADCDFSGPFPVELQADATGAIATTVEVVTRVVGFDEGPVDCRTTSCSVVTFEDELPGDRRGEAALTFDPSAPLRPPPTVSVSPSTGLVDGQVVRIQGDGFRPHAGMFVDQCRDDGTDDPWDCRLFGAYREADADGHLDATLTLRLTFDGERRIDCLEDPCIVTVLDFSGDPIFKLPVEFDPSAVELPALEESCDIAHFQNREIALFGNVTAGPDGNVWFDAIDTGDRARIGYITPQGAITTFDLGDQVTQVSDITTGPDGNVWYTAEGIVWRSTPTGQVTQVANPGSAGPIVTGPDGALWFGMSTGIGRITTGGDLTVFDDPSVGDHPDELGIGPDGELWYAVDGSIRRISGSGSVTTIADDVTDFGVSGLQAAGGAMWTSLEYDDRIGRVTPDGQLTRFGDPHQLDEPVGMVAGPEGALWFVTAQNDLVGRVELDGTITTFVDREGDLREPRSITDGPDGHLWLSAQGSGRARVDRCGLVGPVAASPGFTG